MLKPFGIMPAMVTPFSDDGELNEAAIGTLVDRFVRAGVHGLFCLGTNGEFFSLSEEEKIRVVRAIAGRSAGRLPVYAGAGGISTRETVSLAQKCEEAGANALSVITPYFVPVSQDELVSHYRSVAASTSLPVLLYNIPARTGVTLEPKTVETLAAVPNIVGIKDSSGNFDAVLQFIERTGPDFAVLAGTDSMILSTLMAGGAGAIASTANAMPELVASIYEHWRKGELALAEEAQRKLRPIRTALQVGTLPSALKEAMTLLGLPVGVARPPVGPVSERERSEIERVVGLYDPISPEGAER